MEKHTAFYNACKRIAYSSLVGADYDAACRAVARRFNCPRGADRVKIAVSAISNPKFVDLYLAGRPSINV